MSIVAQLNVSASYNSRRSLYILNRTHLEKAMSHTPGVHCVAHYRPSTGMPFGVHAGPVVCDSACPCDLLYCRLAFQVAPSCLVWVLKISTSMYARSSRCCQVIFPAQGQYFGLLYTPTFAPNLFCHLWLQHRNIQLLLTFSFLAFRMSRKVIQHLPRLVHQRYAEHP